jgi:hypothetical protein
MTNQENIQTQNFINIKALITCVVTFLIFGFLLWEHFHGGVPSHHLLHQENLPAISNWWSGLLLPLLSWFLLGRIEKRIGKQYAQPQQTKNQSGKVIGLFTTGLAFGILIAVSFTYDYKPFLDNVLYFLLLLSLIVPIYYAEFMLGFILGMTYTFGSILPTAFILIIAAIGILIYRFIRPLIIRLTRIFGSSPAKNPNR